MTDATVSPAPQYDRIAGQMRALFEEGSPDVLRDVGPLFEAAEVFEWIKRAHPPEHARTSRDKIFALKQSWGLSPEPLPERTTDPGRSAEVYRAGGLVLDPTPYLPTAAHESFEQWIADAGARLGGEFGMQAPGIECASWDALDRLQALLAPTLALTGPRTYRFNAFLGDYRRTPFGFHVDPHQEAVFQVVLTGRRKGYFWEGLTLSDDDAAWVEDSNGLTPPTREPELVVDLEPGDLVFWPGTHVHGFEAEGPSLALSIVIDRASPRRREDVVAGLEFATMRGKTALPAPEPCPPLTEDDFVQRRSVFALAYERYDDSLIIGTCGRTLEWPDRNSVTAAMTLLDLLGSTHERLAVRDIADRCTDEWLSREEVAEVLTMLKSLGYLR